MKRPSTFWQRSVGQPLHIARDLAPRRVWMHPDYPAVTGVRRLRRAGRLAVAHLLRRGGILYARTAPDRQRAAALDAATHAAVQRWLADERGDTVQVYLCAYCQRRYTVQRHPRGYIPIEQRVQATMFDPFNPDPAQLDQIDAVRAASTPSYGRIQIACPGCGRILV